MTTDQRCKCPEHGGWVGPWKCPAHGEVYPEHLTAPTSSLEEARQSVIRCGTCKGRGGFSDTTMGRGGYGGQMLTGCRSCSGSGLDTRELEAFIKATARAEVIREVEAALREICESGNPHSSPSLAGAFDAGVHAVQFAMRALSQGGEGKSDG